MLGLAGLIVVGSVLSAPWKSGEAARPFLAGAKVEPEVLSILERSCRDCHSDTTHYPWYSYVAPVSFLIRSDVSGGRRHLDFSRWHEYSPLIRQRKLGAIVGQIKDGEMPLQIYLWMHRDARLSFADSGTIIRWAQSERARLIAESAGSQD